MRLSNKEIENIKEIVCRNFEADTIVYLFGSRLDDSKKGGDIDLFVISKKTTNLFEKKIKTLAKLKQVLHKPVDLVLHKNFSREIEKEALRGVVL